MPIPGNCPICRTLLAFPDTSAGTPVRCPVCQSRFIQRGRELAHVSFVDYYQLIGVEPGSDMESIRKLVRSKILEHHPDRNPDDPYAADRLRDVVKAKEILTSMEKRREYNAIYFARELPVWSRVRDGADRGQYGSQTRKSGGQTRSRGIDHLVDEIDDLDPGVRKSWDSIFPGKKIRSSDYVRMRTVWVRIGIAVGALTGAVMGGLHGTFIASILLGVLGGVIGALLAYYPSGLAVLAFFLARMFIASFFLAIIVSRIHGDLWFPPGLAYVLKVLFFATGLGGVGFGFWAIGTSTLQGRSPFLVNLIVLRMGAIGAWLGVLWALFILFVQRASMTPLHPILAWWFVAFTAYLMIDTLVFGRTWVFVRDA